MFSIDTFTPTPRPWAPPATGFAVAALVCGIIGSLATMVSVGTLARAGWILGVVAVAW